MISLRSFLFLLILSLFISKGFCLIGYDCTLPHTNITAVSLGYIHTCSESYDTLNVEDVSIQLLQSQSYSHIKTYSCYILRSRLIYHCGMHSHTTIAHKGLSQELLASLHPEQCTKMVLEAWYTTDLGIMISGIKVNASVSKTVTEIGFISTNEGKCEGASVNIQDNFYQNVVVVSTYQIRVKEFQSTIDLDTNQLIMPSGMRFNTQANSGFDVDEGLVIWDSNLSPTFCNPYSYAVLYEGPAQIYTSIDKTRIIVLNNTDCTFAVTLRNAQLVCHQSSYATDHPKLFVIISPPSLWFFKKTPLIPLNMDLFLYTNSKFVYLEKHFRGQLIDAYNNLNHKLCMLNYNHLHSLISLAYIKPEEFAWAYTHQPGITSVLRGEVIYLITCPPVHVELYHSQRCYQEIPITYKNHTKYLAPRTRIIKEYAEEVECNPLAPSLYRWNTHWYQLHPHPIVVKDPITLTTDIGTTWTYKTSSNLMTSGVYSQQSLESYQKRLLFPIEKEAITYVSAGKMAGKDFDTQGLNIATLFSDEGLEDFKNTFFKKLYGWYSSFALHLSGIGGIIMILYICKSCLNMILNGTLLYKAYGFSYKLLASIWGTLAKHILIFKIANDARPSFSSSETQPRPESISNEQDALLISSSSTVVSPKLYPTLPTSNKSVHSDINNPIL